MSFYCPKQNDIEVTMKKMMIIIALSVAAVCVFGWALSNTPKTVGKNIREKDFKEFYYTYSTTVNPPEFQRYRLYTENGRKMFYHEKREGDRVFLTEEDITVSGAIELTAEEWETFWGCLSGGTVRNRKESVTSGRAAPWLYLYWSGDKNKCQEFTFENPGKEAEFEELCAALAFSMAEKPEKEGDTTVKIDGIVYYNTKEAMPVEPDETVIVKTELPLEGSTSGEKITAYAFIRAGKPGDTLVCLIDGEWCRFEETERAGQP